MDHESSFEFTYSAKEQEELRTIRAKYLPREEQESKMEYLRRLDAGVTRKGTICSLALGVLSTLVMGVGMCCCLVWTQLFILGIVVGCIGILGIIMAYPLYSYITKKEHERIAPEILRLTDELLQ